MKKNILLMITAAVTFLTACNNGSSSDNPANTKQVFLAVFSANAYHQCKVDQPTGLFSCESEPLPLSQLNTPTGVAIYKNHIYINNSAFGVGPDSSVLKCTLNGTQPLTDCVLNNESATQGALDHPIGITFYNDKAYIGNFGSAESNPRYTQCNIADNGDLTPCETITLESTINGTPEVIEFNNNFAYITDQLNNGYFTCNVEENTGHLTNCVLSSLSESSAIVPAVGPRGMLINNGYAYFVNSGFHGGTQIESIATYTKCSVESSGQLSSCQTTALAGLSSPTDIVYDGNYIYITNEKFQGLSYTKCTINSTNGDLENCYTEVGQNEPGTIYYTYLAFY